MLPGVRVDQEGLQAFCHRRGVRKLSLFGSVLRPDFSDDSDIDVLVEFDTTAHPSFFDLFEMEQELSSLFGGRRIDLRTPADLSRHFRDHVLDHAEVQFASG